MIKKGKSLIVSFIYLELKKIRIKKSLSRKKKKKKKNKSGPQELLV